MRVRLRISAFSILFALSAAGAGKEPPAGFHGLKWGDPPAVDMRLTEGRRELESTWVRDGEALGLGGVDAEAIRYFFWKGRLVSVGIRGGAGFPRLVSALSSSWGAGLRSASQTDRYTWVADGPAGRTIAGLDLVGTSGFSLAIFSEELTDAMEVEEALRGASPR
jgi:hypothetical protein